MRLLRKKLVAEKIGVGMSTINRYVANGQFPKPKNAGIEIRWDEDVVDAWMILAFDIKKPLPDIDSQDIAMVETCVKAYQHLKGKSLNLPTSQAV